MDWEEKILDEIYSILGKPDTLVKASAKNVFNNSYRVNLWCEKEQKNLSVTTKYIKHSYMARVRPTGEIIFEPELEKGLYRQIPKQ